MASRAASRSSVHTQGWPAPSSPTGVSTAATIGTPDGTAARASGPAWSKATTMSAVPGSTARPTASATSCGASDSITRIPTANPAARAASSIPWISEAWPNSVVLGVSTVSAPIGPPASVRAARFGRKPRSSMVARTSCRVDCFTRGLWLITRETVW